MWYDWGGYQVVEVGGGELRRQLRIWRLMEVVLSLCTQWLANSGRPWGYLDMKAQGMWSNYCKEAFLSENLAVLSSYVSWFICECHHWQQWPVTYQKFMLPFLNVEWQAASQPGTTVPRHFLSSLPCKIKGRHELGMIKFWPMCIGVMKAKSGLAHKHFLCFLSYPFHWLDV